jgi:hypothetical protein
MPIVRKGIPLCKLFKSQSVDLAPRYWVCLQLAAGPRPLEVRNFNSWFASYKRPAYKQE